jgi:hypothetical protein
VGISGAAAERFALETPYALIFPAFASGSTVGRLFSMKCTWPAITSFTPGGEPF